jgi:SAM-dependent methyltransferase
MSAQDSFATAEMLDLYRWATQDPPTQAAVLAEMYRRIRGQPAQVLREDFAGNAADSVAWVAADSRRRAIAVDIDAPTLVCAKARAQRLLGDHYQRIDFQCGDVLALCPPAVERAQLLCVLNFSCFYFHQRAQLQRYFEHAFASLDETGLLVLNMFGGASAMKPRLDTHRITPQSEAGTAALAPFDYEWEQRSFDACQSRLDCRIHFVVSDPDAPGGRRRIDDAFRYDWRLWSLPELRECLLSAGFHEVQVWRHTAVEERGRTRVCLGPVETLQDLGLWLAYVIAIR